MVGITVGEDGGTGVRDLEAKSVFMLGARRPDEKRLEYVDMVVVGKRVFESEPRRGGETSLPPAVCRQF